MSEIVNMDIRPTQETSLEDMLSYGLTKYLDKWVNSHDLHMLVHMSIHACTHTHTHTHTRIHMHTYTDTPSNICT